MRDTLYDQSFEPKLTLINIVSNLFEKNPKKVKVWQANYSNVYNYILYHYH